MRNNNAGELRKRKGRGKKIQKEVLKVPLSQPLSHLSILATLVEIGTLQRF